jgi:hypothetical protein
MSEQADACGRARRQPSQALLWPMCLSTITKMLSLITNRVRWNDTWKRLLLMLLCALAAALIQCVSRATYPAGAHSLCWGSLPSMPTALPGLVAAWCRSYGTGPRGWLSCISFSDGLRNTYDMCCGRRCSMYADNSSCA